MTIDETLTLKDIARIFHKTPVTIYRWVAAARKGEGNFPLPPGTRKQRLCWSSAGIEEFMKSQSVNENCPPPPLPIESAAEREARHRAALRELEKLGIKF